MTLEHFSSSTPVENCLHLPRLAFVAGVANLLIRWQRPDGHRLDTIPLRVDTADQDTLDGEMRGQKPGDCLSRVGDFDMPAGLTPDIQQQFAELVHWSCP